MATRFLYLTAAIFLGCGLADAPGDPAVIAHRAGSGLWPENSRTAVLGAIDRGLKGIEIDLVLTKDHVPVLSHDVWMTAEFCTLADGTPLGPDERVVIQDLTLAELQAGYLCGGVPLEEHPDAEVKADTHVTFDEFLQLIAEAPELIVHLDIKYEPGSTPEPEIFAEEILGRWKQAALPNPVYASANLPELLRAFRAELPELETSLIWPRFPPGASTTSVALSNELTTVLGVQALAGRILNAEANGAAVAWQVADRQLVQSMVDEGFKMRVWTVNKPSAMTQFCAWPVHGIITDYPEDVPCR